MTQAKGTEIPPEDAVWPVPDGTLAEEALGWALESAKEDLIEVEAQVLALLDAAPVKASEAHPVFVHDLAVLVDTLESIIDKAKDIQAEAASALAHAIPFGTPRIAYPGLRVLTPRWSSTRKAWENDLLAEKVRPRLLTDPETGELRSPEGVLETTLAVVSLIGSNVKSSGLKALGLDANDYCHVEKKPPTVQVTK